MSVDTPTPPTRVRTLRALSVVLAFTAAVGLIFGTAGFTAMNADRGVAVNVTDDDDAYLGYESVASEVDSGVSTEVVRYDNQFGSGLDEFHVSVVDGSGDTIESIDTQLDARTSTTVSVTLSCNTEQDVPLRFEAQGSGGGVSVSLDRTHTVTCDPPETETANATSTPE